MSEPVNLSDVPHRFLNSRAWATLRSFAPNDLLALIYMNAPYPDGNDPSDFFWDHSGSTADAIRCYQTGRSLLRQCRFLLSNKNLIATGLDATGKRKLISSTEWLDLWPMFATNRAVGPGGIFNEVQVFETIPSDIPQGTPTEVPNDTKINVGKPKAGAAATRSLGKQPRIAEYLKQHFPAGVPDPAFYPRKTLQAEILKWDAGLKPLDQATLKKAIEKYNANQTK
jgi:hypothetical protein